MNARSYSQASETNRRRPATIQYNSRHITPNTVPNFKKDSGFDPQRDHLFLPFWSLLGAVRVSGHCEQFKSDTQLLYMADTGTLPLDDRNINSASPRQHMSHMDCRSFVYPCQWMFIGYVCYLNSWSLEVCRTKNRLRWYERYIADGTVSFPTLEPESTEPRPYMSISVHKRQAQPPDPTPYDLLSLLTCHSPN
ncbi:putative transcriptional regulatory protein C3C7.04 [Fusarium oxysporum f. sp. albedinis]|nr:putative transcriptional regulatory protein C3C7.04 [Fusarium oxysporum f. sp. albedinis]